MIDRAGLKYTARVNIANTKPSPYLVTLIYCIIFWVVNYLVTRLGNPLLTALYGWQGEEIFSSGLTHRPLLASILTTQLLIGEVFTIVLNIMMQIVTVGYMSYCLGIARGAKVSYSNLGDGFNRFLTLLCIIILTGIFTFLWSLLLIIPGIVASYRYRLAFYIALDHPEYGALRCIRESKELMRGYKWALFVLDLSFLGWYILCVLTFGILYIWKMPYFETTYALFYNSRIGRGEKRDTFEIDLT